MKRVLNVLATSWDQKQLESCRERWREDYELVFVDPSDADCPHDLDVQGFLARTVAEWRGRADGVFSSSDYPGAMVAAVLAERLGHSGALPEHVVRCSHKYYSRLSQREIVPHATPPFQLVDPNRLAEAARELAFPCFVKPVKGTFSLHARRVEDLEDLRSFLARPAVSEFREYFLSMFNQLVRGCTSLELDGDYFIAEGLLRGNQTTVEGFCFDGKVEILGTVDSVMYPGTKSFQRFDYPSALDEGVRLRMEDCARRALQQLPLECSLFNVELMHDPETNEIHIIEINPRMCGQFADLYAKVDGTNGYEVALALATGRRPVIRRGSGPCAAASSFALRTFEPVRVLRVPDEDEIRAVEAALPGTLIWNEVHTGQELADFVAGEDGSSVRYAVVNAGAGSREELDERFEEIRAALGYRFERLE